MPSVGVRYRASEITAIVSSQERDQEPGQQPEGRPSAPPPPRQQRAAPTPSSTAVASLQDGERSLVAQRLGAVPRAHRLEDHQLGHRAGALGDLLGHGRDHRAGGGQIAVAVLVRQVPEQVAQPAGEREGAAVLGALLPDADLEAVDHGVAPPVGHGTTVSVAADAHTTHGATTHGGHHADDEQVGRHGAQRLAGAATQPPGDRAAPGTRLRGGSAWLRPA